MDIFDSRYFKINKNMIERLGLWPFTYNYRKHFYIRFFIITTMISSMLPQITRIYFYFGVDTDIVIDHLATFVFFTGTYMKFFTLMYSQKKFKKTFERISRHWDAIRKDEVGKKILIEHWEIGRLITIFYTVMALSSGLTFALFPLLPISLDYIMPLNTSRPTMFILGGEFFFDRNNHYKMLYIFDMMTVLFTVNIVIATDTFYAVIIEHGVGIMSIIKYRLKHSIEFVNKKNKMTKLNNGVVCKMIIEVIKLHQEAIDFVDLFQSAISVSLLILLGFNLAILILELIMCIMKMDDTLELIRYCFVVFGVVVHLLYFSWPSQRIIDYSSDLYQDAYLNEWYEGSREAQKLLQFTMLRCKKPCQFTAGGMYVLNFTDFALILKTAVSYVMILASLR